MCFSVAMIEHFLIMLVVIGIILGIVRILLPPILGMLGVAGGMISSAINLVIYGVLIIFAIKVIFLLFNCASF